MKNGRSHERPFFIEQERGVRRKVKQQNKPPGRNTLARQHAKPLLRSPFHSLISRASAEHMTRREPRRESRRAVYPRTHFTFDRTCERATPHARQTTPRRHAAAPSRCATWRCAGKRIDLRNGKRGRSSNKKTTSTCHTTSPSPGAISGTLRAALGTGGLWNFFPSGRLVAVGFGDNRRAIGPIKGCKLSRIVYDVCSKPGQFRLGADVWPHRLAA